MMSNTNGFHSSSLSISDNDRNDAAKCVKSSRSKTKNIVSITIKETRSTKGFDKKIDEKKKHLEHSDTNNNNNSTKKAKHHSEHIPSTHTHYCHSCGECHGEMITCNFCSTTFHLLCTKPSLTEEDKSKGYYSCENCRTRNKKNKQEKLILPFSFDPKKNLQLNGLKKNQQFHSTLGQIKLPTASNGQSLIQPSGEIKFRATSNNNNNKSKHLSNLKRKRTDSSPPTPPSQSSTINSPNTQLEALHRLFLSCQSEEFHGPSCSSNNSDKHHQKSCFLCRKSSIKQGPSIQCDYCPLAYHLDCLTPPIKSLPLFNEKWMCPNHMSPLLDRYLSRKTTFSTSNRVKISHQYSQIEDNIIIQDFTHNKSNNHQLQRVDISEIPKAIEEFYSQANTQPKLTNEIQSKEQPEENLSSTESSSAYDPSIWDILQAIVNDIVNNYPYEFSSIIENNNPIKSLSKPLTNTLDTIDTLLQALNEPDSTRNDLEQNQISSSFSDLIDLTQFRLSHAALIHLHTQNVIYIRKHVIWFGSSSFNDICLENFNLSHTCQCITERHACLYYDQKRNLFELLNYSEYGTIVNDIRYGIGDDDENINLQKCFCCTKSLCPSTWDGPAQIEQGTVIKIGCHEFLFYRHIVR